MSRLEDLCRPYLEYVTLQLEAARAGGPLEADRLRKGVLDRLDEMRSKSEEEPKLRRDFASMERPLVFFTDYMVKESGLPCAAAWRELAREYNELSGDEKFFDLMSEALEDPDAAERLRLFYLMLGLGFEGVYRGDGDFIEKRMKLCSARFEEVRPLEVKELYVEPSDGSRVRSTRSALGWILCASIGFALIALVFNFIRFAAETSDYRRELSACVRAADFQASPATRVGSGLGKEEGK